MNFDLWDRIRDWVLLAMLLLFSLVCLLAYNEPMVRGLRATALEVTARLEEGFSWAGGYFRALEENSALRETNIQLSSQLARSRAAQIENARLRRLLALQQEQPYPLKAARIIDKDITRQQNFFLLDVGKADGIDIDMAVIDERGILGKVILVSDHYAKVMSYLNTDFRIPALVQPNGIDGIIRWEGDLSRENPDLLLLEHIVKTEPVAQGDSVVASGYSAIFPRGYPIGVIDSVAALSGRNALLVYLTPFARLRDAEHAFVVLKRPDPERLTLKDTPIR